MNDIILLIIGATVGGAITKLTELWVESIKRRNEVKSRPVISRIEDVLTWRWDGKALLKRLIEQDRDLIGEELTPLREGTVEQWAPVFMAHPDGWALLTAGPKNIVGYWSIVALNDDHYALAKAGELFDSQIKTDTVVPFDFPGVYNAYFSHLGVLPGYRPHRRKLIEAFYENLEQLASKGVFFREICANAFSDEGIEICKGFMTYIGPHKDFGHVYSLPLFPWPKRLQHKRWHELERLYQKAYQEHKNEAEHVSNRRSVGA
ncbi:hypothetical protein SAMN02745166_02782 [Prosthecobacter debontii]|uniref:Uncharacterized protein n=1 Tax=Prosthecobacter debontii TaxID=48467 RepID=A0A1T4YB83_9BACT|nr:hypothetical protein [Prosthecobacter debontii]SKA98525.1 hypothetical protein SAMN02745166_02782 [Prosthecobacter debontii]